MPPDEQPGSPILVVLRGNSGSGKTSTAREVRRRYGRGCALIEQDHVRRIMLREHEHDDGVAARLIPQIAATALAGGFHVLVEGILAARRYGGGLRDLVAGHDGPSHVYYFDVSWDETVRRHAGRAGAADFTVDQMRDWYMPGDRLGVEGERVIPERASFEDVVTTILQTSGLSRAAPLSACPTRCPHC